MLALLRVLIPLVYELDLAYTRVALEPTYVTLLEKLVVDESVRVYGR